MIVSCPCKSVSFEVTGSPIACVVCHCKDCEAGARQLEALPNARAVSEATGGTAYVAFRKDRVACTAGASLLENMKLHPGSATNRVVARCCNAPMFLGFDDARHWVSMVRARFGQNAPPVQMHICTKSKADGSTVPEGVPSHASYPPAFMVKLLGAKIAMLLRL